MLGQIPAAEIMKSMICHEWHYYVIKTGIIASL